MTEGIESFLVARKTLELAWEQLSLIDFSNFGLVNKSSKDHSLFAYKGLLFCCTGAGEIPASLSMYGVVLDLERHCETLCVMDRNLRKSSQEITTSLTIREPDINFFAGAVRDPRNPEFIYKIVGQMEIVNQIILLELLYASQIIDAAMHKNLSTETFTKRRNLSRRNSRSTNGISIKRFNSLKKTISLIMRESHDLL